jgi:hypothetical protein
VKDEAWHPFNAPRGDGAFFEARAPDTTERAGVWNILRAACRPASTPAVEADGTMGESGGFVIALSFGRILPDFLSMLGTISDGRLRKVRRNSLKFCMSLIT